MNGHEWKMIDAHEYCNVMTVIVDPIWHISYIIIAPRQVT
jgi:hypothetical protein